MTSHFTGTEVSAQSTPYHLSQLVATSVSSSSEVTANCTSPIY